MREQRLTVNTVARSEQNCEWETCIGKNDSCTFPVLTLHSTGRGISRSLPFPIAIFRSLYRNLMLSLCCIVQLSSLLELTTTCMLSVPAFTRGTITAHPTTICALLCSRSILRWLRFVQIRHTDIRSLFLKILSFGENRVWALRLHPS